MKFESLIVHEEECKTTTVSHVMPIHATSSFNFEDIDQGIAIFSGKETGHVYSRYGNPTIESVATKIAKMESYGMETQAFGIMVSSGMAAISTLCFSLLKKGDAVLTQANLYGGTTELFRKFLIKFGIDIIWTDFNDLVSVEQALADNPNIRMVYCESPANPSLACVDLEAVSTIAKQYQLWTVVDNTFCTPYVQQVLKLGFDFAIHSTTKFLNGHGNSIAGVIIGKDPAHYNTILDGMKLIGTSCNAFDAWLLNNGMKTLALRMKKHAENALAIANYLSSSPFIATVNYPFLKTHPTYEIAKKQMLNGGGMLSFELKGGLEAGIKAMNKISFCSLAPTLGDVDTLILHPASMSHRNIDKKIREANGITDGLIRLSVGIENVQDIIDDLEQSFQG